VADLSEQPAVFIPNRRPISAKYAHLRSHLINSALLRSDDFDNFIRDRATKLLDLIEKAIGKSVTGRDSDEVIAAFGGKLTSSIPGGNT
jgi:hypothetical protein